jgi:hypothetical protein
MAEDDYWCACVRCDNTYYGSKYSVLCPDCDPKAQGTEARRAATSSGAVHDGPVPEGNASGKGQV